MNLYTAFQEACASHAKPILVTLDSAYSFTDIDQYSARIANQLMAWQLAPGDRVIAQVEKSEFALFLYFACLRSGLIYVPLNPANTASELAYFFENAKPALIICTPDKEGLVQSICHKATLIKTMNTAGEGSLLENIAQHSCVHRCYSAQEQELACILYTSGTTGKPKGAMLSHQGLLANAQALVSTWQMTANDVLLHLLPLYHVHGLFFAIHTALLSHATILLAPKFDTEYFFAWLAKASVFMGVPTYYTRLLADSRLTKENCEAMRLFISGSAPLLPTTFEIFQQRTGHTILERYGMTETGITFSNPASSVEKAGTVGQAIPGVSFKIMHHNKELPRGKIGHVLIKSPSVCLGYWQSPEKTVESFTKDGYFKTGDLGFLDKAGYLTLIGRARDLIITGGLNVYPKEIELTIDAFPGVIESAVIGIPHPDFGESVTAIVAIQKKLNKNILLRHIRHHHAGYKCPKRIVFVNQLPKNTLGKVQKNQLRERMTAMAHFM